MLFTPIRAKLHRPISGDITVPRPHLLHRLDNGLAGKITLVSAPAGFGKSTIICQWLEHLDAHAGTSRSPKTCWLSLDETDNQLPRFVSYLILAIEEQYPRSCATVTELLHGKESPVIEVLADVLANVLTLLPQQLIVILDDLHTIDNPAIYAFLTRLIQHTTNRLHLVLITRVDPPLSLNIWRAQGQLNELRLHELAFTLAETPHLLSKQLDQMPSATMIAMLHERTEGWAVGLRLAALALHGQTDYNEFAINMKAASSRYIVDYLVDNVLDQQSAEMQRFLFITAILARFSAGLCAAVMEITEATAQQYINDIARANLFLIDLSTPAYSYRYHHQFQNMLLSRLHERYEQQAIVQLHRQAAEWLATHGQIEEALHHLTAIPDFVAAADLIEKQRIAALNEQRFHELESWLARLPSHLLHQRPALLLGQAWIQHYWLEYAHCLNITQLAATRLQEQAATLPQSTLQLFQAEILALRISTDRTLDQTQMPSQIKQAWQHLHPMVNSGHSFIPIWLAAISQRLGQIELAEEVARTTIEEATAWPEIARARVRYSYGLNFYYEYNLVQSERVMQENLRLARQYDWPLIAALSHFRLASIARLCNQRGLAEQYFLEVIKEPHLNNGRLAAPALHRLIEFYAWRGQPEGAHNLIAYFKDYARMIDRPYLLSQIAALEAYIALHTGDLKEALHWALTGLRGASDYSADRVPVIRAQILMAEGSAASLREASLIWHGLLQRHESERSGPMWLDTVVPLTITWYKLGEKERAFIALANALQRAVPNGIVGPFVEAGEPMAMMLNQLKQQPQHADPVQLLLTAFPSTSALAAPIAPHPALPDPLTERELSILELLANRLSNKEIAQQLILSPHTVRNHMANIFGKLQVENRVQAIERAHALGLLSSNKRLTV